MKGLVFQLGFETSDTGLYRSLFKFGQEGYH